MLIDVCELGEAGLQLLGKEHRQVVEVDAVVFAHDRVRVESPGDPACGGCQVGKTIDRAK